MGTASAKAGKRRTGWLANQPIQRKLLLAFGLVAAMFVLASSLLFAGISEEEGARYWTDHTYTVIVELKALGQAARSEQSALRGYVLTTQPAMLQTYQRARLAFAGHLARVQQLTADNAQEQARTVVLGELMRRFRQERADPLIDLAGRPGNQAAIDAMLRSTTSRSYIEQVQGVLDQMEATESGLLAGRVAHLRRATDATRVTTIGVMALGLGAGLLVLVLLRRQITRPLQHVTTLIERLADNDHDIEIPRLDRRDEIGAISRALQVFKRMAIETQANNWVKTQAADLSSRLQSAGGESAFATTLLNRLAPLLKAGVGVFYALPEGSDRLTLLGSYGLRDEQGLAREYRLGEGLVGQCALDGGLMVVNDVADDFLRVHAALGEMRPRCIVLVPVAAIDRLLGVIEFGCLQPIDRLQERLLDELGPLIALSLDNLTRAIETRRLLAETKKKAEELRASEEVLRAQKEELRATNDQLHARTSELQEQSARLQASEEELRVQTEELRVTNEELRENTEHLHAQKRMLEALQKETEDKAAALARASQYKSEFLANMSHELRTPLNSLLILSRSLAENEQGNLDAEQVESARIIHESGSNLLRLINDILDLSKVEAGKMQVSVEPLRLETFAATLRRNFRHVAQDKQLGFEVELAPGLPDSIATDGPKLEQIVNNLVGNAFKFTKAGEVRVRIARADAGMHVGTSGLDPAQSIMIAVSDTGIGIPPDKFEKIFQAFEQVDAGTSRQFGGTGLGLSISSGMAQLLGGEIQVASTPGAGTTFTVLLPLEAPGSAAAPQIEAAPASAATVAATPAARAPRALAPASVPDDRDAIRPGDTVILAIEDDLAFLRILIDTIRRKGHRALAAGDGETGLALARQFHPTGVLLDVMLPGMDGWSVLERLKAENATRHIPVHFISAVGEQGRGRELGAVGFLTKPVSRESLVEAFDRLLHFAENRTRRVLIVDDDDASRVAIRKLIEPEGAEIVEAASAEEALQRLGESSCDCVILDLGLPGMSGFEFLEHIAQQSAAPPVVVYSGRDLTREESLRLRAHTDSIVIKGARSPERLLDEVSLFLHSIRQRGTTSAPVHGDRFDGHGVLLVDDDMRNIFALSRTLRGKGLDVIVAQDGLKALKQLDAHPDVGMVLMDIMMPGMDGYETIGEIRKQARFRELPIIALTAKAMSGDREKCLEVGASDYLSKPIDVDKLLSMMRVWMRA